MLMLSLALGLVALGHTRLAVTGWVAGIAAFAVVVSFRLRPVLAGGERRCSRRCWPGR